MILIEIPPVSPPLKPKMVALLFSLDDFQKNGPKTPVYPRVLGYNFIDFRNQINRF